MEINCLKDGWQTYVMLTIYVYLSVYTVVRNKSKNKEYTVDTYML